ncbi:hypothetical protein [Mycobacterium dioxanotrophicus]|uniref:hypothetical protein n=1 Tax=Mycobacterium dioxanotrophicus TaxID=482462 RepID=UPI0012FB2595|nr:hypothetical protein [Mycobacterium dioxanotrophicus]
MLINNVDNPVFVWRSINSRLAFERMNCRAARVVAKQRVIERLGRARAGGWNQPDSSPNCRRHSRAGGRGVTAPGSVAIGGLTWHTSRTGP